LKRRTKENNTNNFWEYLESGEMKSFGVADAVEEIERKESRTMRDLLEQFCEEV